MFTEMGASVAAALAIAGASAGDEDGQPNAIVVEGVREEGDISRRPGGTDVVPAEDYADKVAVSLRDALAFSPGVYAQPRFGQEVRLSIRGSGISRGFHMRGLTLLQDGIPINLADDNGDFQELDPVIFRQIQVLKGANALRFGGSTLGGAINAVTPTGASTPGWALRLDGGSDETVRAVISYGATEDWGDAWLAASGDRSDGQRLHEQRRALRLNGNIGLKIGEGAETRFYASLQSIDQELPGALPYEVALNSPRSGNFVGDQQRDINSVRLQNRTSFLLGQARAEAGAFVNVKRLFHPIFQVVDQKSTDYGLFARVDWATGPIELSAGITARFGSLDSLRFVNVNGRRGNLTFKAALDAVTVDAYAEARYRLGKLTLVAGGIFTHGSRRQEQVFPNALTAKAEFDAVSPKLGMLYEPRADVQLYANYSRSHELPGFVELAQIASFVPLEAQRAWTAEAGIRGRLGMVSFDVSAYRARVRGELVQFTTGPDIPAATFNADATVHQGIEAGVDLDLGSWLRLRQVYQLNDFRFRNDRQFGDNRLPVIPKHLYRAELRIGSEAANLSPYVEWIPRGAWADYANSFKVKGYATLGATAGAAIGKNISLFVDLRNLTAKRAVGDITAVINYASLAPSQQAIFYPVERRSVFGGIRAHF